jgi:nucleoid-associated protein YgaU
MSEKTNSSLENLKSKAFKIAALGSVAMATVVAAEQFNGQAPHAGHDKVYTTQPGDTEWTLAQRAYPDSDPRDVIGLINSQESAQERKDHTLQPGDKIYFASDSKLGTDVNTTVVAATEH